MYPTTAAITASVRRRRDTVVARSRRVQIDPYPDGCWVMVDQWSRITLARQKISHFLEKSM